jgi:hypothetical protein
MNWLKEYWPEFWALSFHVPNESRGTPKHHEIRAKEGVKPGVYDIVCLKPWKGYPYAVFEMKRRDRTKSVISRDQKAFGFECESAGGFVAVCYGVEQFKLAFMDYVG